MCRSCFQAPPYVHAKVHEDLRAWNKKAHKLYNQYMGVDLIDKNKVVKKRKNPLFCFLTNHNRVINNTIIITW